MDPARTLAEAKRAHARLGLYMFYDLSALRVLVPDAQLGMFNNNRLSGPVPETFAQCKMIRALTFGYEAGRTGLREGRAYCDNEELYVTAGVKTRILAAIGELAMSKPCYEWWPKDVPWPFTWPREVAD